MGRPTARTMPTSSGSGCTASSSLDRGEEYQYGLFDPDESRVLGSFGLMTRRGRGTLEIGYWVHVDATGHGHATRAAAALTDVALRRSRREAGADLHRRGQPRTRRDPPATRLRAAPHRGCRTLGIERDRPPAGMDANDADRRARTSAAGHRCSVQLSAQMEKAFDAIVDGPRRPDARRHRDVGSRASRLPRRVPHPVQHRPTALARVHLQSQPHRAGHLARRSTRRARAARRSVRSRRALRRGNERRASTSSTGARGAPARRVPRWSRVATGSQAASATASTSATTSDTCFT